MGFKIPLGNAGLLILGVLGVLDVLGTRYGSMCCTEYIELYIR